MAVGAEQTQVTESVVEPVAATVLDDQGERASLPGLSLTAFIAMVRKTRLA
jgi:hypothetical protein